MVVPASASAPGASPGASAEFSALTADLSKAFQAPISKALPGVAGAGSGMHLAWCAVMSIRAPIDILDGFRLLRSPGAQPSILHVAQLQKWKHSK